MNKPKTSPRIEIVEARKPKKKTSNPDPFARVMLHPLEELEARDADKDFPSENLSPGTVSTPSTVSTVSTVSTPGSAKKQKHTLAAAPERDFQKVANSVVRSVSEGIFTGKSKQLYDYLYSLTRGFIQPRRTVRISKPKLMRGAAIGSPGTFYKNIQHLETIGLIKKHEIPGEQQGNEYEIFLPEEINLDPVHPVQSAHPVQSDRSDQKPVVPVLPETVLGGLGPRLDNTGTSATPKTSFKDFKESDDELRARIFDKLDSAAREKTGRGFTEKDYPAMNEVFDLLIAETEVAAARTSQVSNYFSFLAENLRRRLNAKSKFEKKGSEPKKDRVGETRISEPQPLDDEAKQIMLESYQKFFADFGMEWVDQNEEFFTPEDWQWIKSELARIEEQE